MFATTFTPPAQPLAAQKLHARIVERPPLGPRRGERAGEQIWGRFVRCDERDRSAGKQCGPARDLGYAAGLDRLDVSVCLGDPADPEPPSSTRSSITHAARGWWRARVPAGLIRWRGGMPRRTRR